MRWLLRSMWIRTVELAALTDPKNAKSVTQVNVLPRMTSLTDTTLQSENGTKT